MNKKSAPEGGRWASEQIESYDGFPGGSLMASLGVHCATLQTLGAFFLYSHQTLVVAKVLIAVLQTALDHPGQRG